MKKTLLIVLSVIATLCFAFGFAACGGTHTHTYSDAWSADEEYHWHAATCEHSSEVTDKDEHDFKDGKCSVCGYEHGELRVSVDTKEFVAGTISDGAVLTVKDVVVKGQKLIDTVEIGFSFTNGLSVLAKADRQVVIIIKDGKIYMRSEPKEGQEEDSQGTTYGYATIPGLLREAFILLFKDTPESVIAKIESYLPDDMTITEALAMFVNGVTPESVEEFINLYLPEGITVDGILDLIERKASFEEIKEYIPETAKDEINGKLPEGITYDGIVALIEKLIDFETEDLEELFGEDGITIEEVKEFLPEGISAEAVSALIPLDLSELGEEYAELLATFTEGTEELEYVLYRFNSVYTVIAEIIPDGITMEEIHGLLPEGVTLETLESIYGLKEGTLEYLIWLISGITPEKAEALKDGVSVEEIEALLPEGFIDFIDGFIQGLPAKIYGDEYAETVNYDEFVVTYEGIKQFIINLTTLTEDDFNELLTDGVSLEEFEGLLPEEGLTVAGINVLLPEGFKLEDIFGYLSNVTKDNIEALEDGATVSEILALLPDGYEQMISAYLPEGVTLADIINAIENIPIDKIINALNDLTFENVVADAAEEEIAVDEVKADLAQWIIDTLFVARKDGDEIVFNLNYDLINVLNDYLYTTTLKDVADSVFGEGWYDGLDGKINSVLDVTVSEILDSAKENGLDVIETLESVRPIVNAFIDVITAKEPEPETEDPVPEPYDEEIGDTEENAEDESFDYVGYVIDFLKDEENLKLTVGDVIVKIIDKDAITSAELLKGFIKPIVETVGNRTFYDLILVFTGYYEDAMMLITKPSDEKAEETKATYKSLVEYFVDYIKTSNPVSFTVDANGKIVKFNASLDLMGSFAAKITFQRGAVVDYGEIETAVDEKVESVDLDPEKFGYAIESADETYYTLTDVKAVEGDQTVTICKSSYTIMMASDYDDPSKGVISANAFIYEYEFDKAIYSLDYALCTFFEDDISTFYIPGVKITVKNVFLDDIVFDIEGYTADWTEDDIYEALKLDDDTIKEIIETLNNKKADSFEVLEELSFAVLEDGRVVLQDDLGYFIEEDMPEYDEDDDSDYEEVA